MLSLPAAMGIPPQQLSVRAAVEAYHAGDRRRALDGLDTREWTAGLLTSELDAWVRAAGMRSEPRRRFVAAAFALDAVWTATRPFAHARWSLPAPRAGKGTALNSEASQGVVATWAVRQIPVGGAVTAAERGLWLAAIGVAEDGSAWRALLTEILPLARKRLPDDARTELAMVLARTNIDLGTLRYRSWYRSWNFSVLREEDLPSTVTRRIPGAIQALEALLTDASLAGEVELRIGYLELRRRNWPDALTRFDAAREKAAAPVLRATADYLAGWVHEQLDQPDEAIAAYRRAVAITPTMRNVATRLSALLFLRDEPAEGYAILDRALNARPVPLDLLVSLERGDGRFVGDWLSTVRQGLQGMAGS